MPCMPVQLWWSSSLSAKYVELCAPVTTPNPTVLELQLEQILPWVEQGKWKNQHSIYVASEIYFHVNKQMLSSIYWSV